jgi:hypothetical protein
VPVPELETSVFLVPGDKVKKTEERLVVLNRIARSVIDSVRGMHPEYVFVHKPIRLRSHDREAGVELKPIQRMNNTAWRNARERAANKWEEQTGQPAPMGFRRVRVDDMKHAFGGGYALRVCRSKIVRTCSATRMGASQRTTLRLNLRT